jgi:cytochrome c peroxidase
MPNKLGFVLTSLIFILGVDYAYAADRLKVNEKLSQSQFLESSNGAYRFNLQGDGNLVLREQSSGDALWSSKTNGTNGTRLSMQTDGNLVLYTSSNAAVWASGTNGTGATSFTIQNDGNAVIRTSSGTSVWSTGTSNGGGSGDDNTGGGTGGGDAGTGGGSGGGTGGETANSTGEFSTPSAALYSLNSNKILGFPKHIDTGFGGNGHAESWDGRFFVRTQTKGWFASAFRPERIVRNNDGSVDFKQGAFGNSITLELKTDEPTMQHNWLAIVPDFSVSGENPYPSNSSGNYQQTGTHRTYKALVYHTTADKQMGIRKATFIISDANTRNAQLIKADFTNSFNRLRLQSGVDFKCIEPSVTIDGRLVVCQGHPNNDGKIDNLVYSYTKTPGSTTNWTAPKSISNMYFDDRNTNIEGLPFAERYPVAQQPILDSSGNDYNRGELIKGAYPWISRDGTEIFYQASREGVSSARRAGTSVVGRWTGWAIRHIDGPINGDRKKTSRLFLSSPGAFTTMWTPFKDIADLAIPYSLQGPVYPIFGSNTSDYSEIGFDDYLDGNYVMYLGMNELLDRAGSYKVTQTNDTSGNFNNASLVGARFPIEFNGQDITVGRYGQAIHFNSNNYLNVTKNAGWDSLSESVSVDMWVRKSSGSGRVRLFNMQNGVELNLINGSTLSASIHDTNSNLVQINGSSISNNTWTHVAFTFNAQSKEMTLYVNGQSVATKNAGNFGTLRTSGAVRVGLDNSSGQVILDEVKVSNVARRAYEIAHNANVRTNTAPSSALASQVPDHLRSLLDNATGVDRFSTQAAALGEDLFSDEILSKQRTTSCATCHNDTLAFADGLDIARGNEPTDAGNRNTPMLQNRLFSSLQGWSGLAGTLDTQAIIPISAVHEMNLPLAEAVQRLRADSTYASRFQQVYGEQVNETNLAAAIASFEAIQFSPKNRVDDFKEGDTSALTASERRGLDLFESKARCSGCHSGANLTDESFRNNGLAMNDDIGRAEVTGRDRDHKLFKVPSLRELGLTGPYMHDGSISTLKEVVEKYNAGARNVAATDSDIRALELSNQEVNDVVAYLAALSVNGDSGGTGVDPSVSEVTRVDGNLVGGAGSSKPGFTLYVFDNDKGSNGSNCNGGCATAWPPVFVEDSAASGLSGLSTITRNDGTKQAAFEGRPLYFYAQDTNAGDKKGAGVNNTWWLAANDDTGGGTGGGTGGTGEGTITRQVWTGVSGTGLSALTGLTSYPNNPTATNQLTSFEAQSNWADNYGTRIVGYLHAPVTGEYTFWIATDDNGELWLSTNDSASNKQRIASISNWAGVRNWTKFPSQKSASITLQAGQRYYIEALQKEGGGGDNIAVAWQRPGGSLEVIPGEYLSPFTDTTPAPTTYTLTVTNGSGDNKYVSGANISITADAAPSGQVFDRWVATSGSPGIANVTTATTTVTMPARAATVTATYKNGVSLRNAENPANTINGLDYSYYNGSWNALPNFTALTPVKTGSVSNFSIGGKLANDNFGFAFKGFINLPTDGTYTFYTNSDDGSKLYIGNTEVVNNDGLHGNVQQSGQIGLKAGKHAVSVDFFEKTGGEVLEVRFQGPGINKQLIPNNALYRVTQVTHLSNVALGKPTSQSSTAAGGLSQRAVDGNTSGNWGTGSVTHTAGESKSWWQVNLGSAHQISRVTLWNRTDCCSSRLSNYHVDGLDANGNVIVTQNISGVAGDKTDINLTAEGVYSVRVQLNGSNYLSLAEVQVFGEAGNTGGSSDTTRPVITLIGSAQMNIMQGTAFNDPGASASDDRDGNLTGSISRSGTVNTSKVGSYALSYNVNDAAGNPARSVTRTVNVTLSADTTKPVITLNGNQTMTIVQGASFSDPGATASDNRDGNISNAIAKSGSVNTANVGSYTLSYNVSDAAGNKAATVTRRVNVILGADNTSPSITLLGNKTMSIVQGTSFNDPGADASDDRDGNITSEITKSGSVNTNQVGAYTLSYNVKDAAGNSAPTVQRTVNVTGSGSSEVTHIGSTADYDRNDKINISAPSNAAAGDLLLLFLSRTDDLLPIRLDGWTAGASCFKTTNGQSDCHEIRHCTNRDGDYCLNFDGGNGRDLATVVFYKTLSANENRNYSFDLRGSKASWAIMSAVRGANNNDPIRNVATESNDNNPDSLFPSVNGNAGDLLLMSMAFDDTTKQDDFRAPSGMEMHKWIAGEDEAGYVYGQKLTQTGATGSKKTQGNGGSNAKDALISLTIKPSGNVGGGDTGGGDTGGGTGGGDSATGNNTLELNQQLNVNEYLASENGRYRLYLQGDGNIVLRDQQSGAALWSSKTNGKGGTRLVLQGGDGNLVLYTASGNAVWASGTNGTGASRLVVNNDGSLAIYSGTNPVWAENGTGDTGSGGGGSGGTGGTAQTFEKRISSSQDDAEEQSNGSVNTTSTDLELVFDNSNQRTGMRFTNVTIPQGAEITRAYIQFTTDETNSGSTSLRVFAQDIDDAAAFSNSGNNISNRDTTNASSSWSPSAWNTVGAAGSDQRTNELKSVVQEVINRGGWKSGNDMAFIISGTGERTAESFDGSSGQAPLLHIEYSGSGGNTGGGDTGGNTGGGEGTKIAFIGDTGAGGNFQNVLNLIKAEGAELTIVAGDTSYSSSRDDDWDAMVRNTLGNSDPALVVAGNHDYGDSNFGNVRSFGQNRLNRQSAVQCSGDYAEKMNCNYKNVHFVMSAIGASGSQSSHESFISNSLNNIPDGAWRICAWHKNQRDMQVGGKTDETGWTAYETCRQQGAIITTGHEHSYSRTHLLSDMSSQTIASKSSTMTVEEGKTIAFVSGLGGVGIRDQERGGDHWAKIYTSSQGARYGAMFGTFYEDRAEFYFKNINGQIIDQFTVMKGY